MFGKQMMNEIQRKVQLCSSTEKRIIELYLQALNGYILIHDGFKFGITPTETRLLDRYVFADRVRVFSNRATMDWFCNGNIWHTLQNIQHINFQGFYHQDTLEKILQQCTDLRVCSFTYWACSDFCSVLKAIISKKLVELSANVNGTFSTFSDTLQTLKCQAEKLKLYGLDKLMFIFAENIPNDLSFIGDPMFANLMNGDGKIIFLFQNEPSDMCMKVMLKANGFVHGGYYRIAHNDPHYFDSFDGKVYEIYRYFYKRVGEINWYIGCREKFKPYFEVPSKCSEDESMTKIIQNMPPSCTPFSDPLEEHDKRTSSRMWDREPEIINITPLKAVPETEECCDFLDFKEKINVEKDFYGQLKLFSLIQNATIHETGKVELFFTNGFYVLVPPNVSAETMDIIEPTPRFILSSSIAIPSLTMVDFLKHLVPKCTTLELQGYWFLEAASEALKLVRYKTKSLIMMRLWLEQCGKADKVLARLFNSISPQIRCHFIQTLFCDTRDFLHMDVGEIIDAISNHFDRRTPLKQLVLFIQEPLQPLQKYLEKLVDAVAPGACVTVISCKRPYVDEVEEMSNNNVHMIAIPKLFSNNGTSTSNHVMKCFSFRLEDRFFYFLFPLDEPVYFK